MNILDSIANSDIIEKITIVKKGDAAKTFDAVKVFEEGNCKKCRKRSRDDLAQNERELKKQG